MTEIEGVKFYNIMELSKLLKVTSATVRRYIASERLKGQRIGRNILVTEKSLHRFLGIEES